MVKRLLARMLLGIDAETFDGGAQFVLMARQARIEDSERRRLRQAVDDAHETAGAMLDGRDSSNDKAALEMLVLAGAAWKKVLPQRIEFVRIGSRTEAHEALDKQRLLDYAKIAVGVSVSYLETETPARPPYPAEAGSRGAVSTSSEGEYVDAIAEWGAVV